MSTIADELTRIQNAKASLATSIAAKGVEVPAATKIDGYAALVDQISQGGGGVVKGSLTLTESAQDVTIVHNLGTQNIEAFLLRKTQMLDVYNTNGAYYMVAQGFDFAASATGTRRGYIHITFESRTGWDYITCNSRDTGSTFSIDNNSITFGAFQSNFPLLEGEYDYIIRAL